jgi:hypothetical protein
MITIGKASICDFQFVFFFGFFLYWMWIRIELYILESKIRLVLADATLGDSPNVCLQYLQDFLSIKSNNIPKLLLQSFNELYGKPANCGDYSLKNAVLNCC